MKNYNSLIVSKYKKTNVIILLLSLICFGVWDNKNKVLIFFDHTDTRGHQVHIRDWKRWTFQWPRINVQKTSAWVAIITECLQRHLCKTRKEEVLYSWKHVFSIENNLVLKKRSIVIIQKFPHLDYNNINNNKLMSLFM